MSRLLGYWDLVCFWTGCFWGHFHLFASRAWLDSHDDWWALRGYRVCLRCGAEFAA